MSNPAKSEELACELARIKAERDHYREQLAKVEAERDNYREQAAQFEEERDLYLKALCALKKKELLENPTVRTEEDIRKLVESEDTLEKFLATLQ